MRFFLFTREEDKLKAKKKTPTNQMDDLDQEK